MKFFRALVATQPAGLPKAKDPESDSAHRIAVDGKSPPLNHATLVDPNEGTLLDRPNGDFG